MNQKFYTLVLFLVFVGFGFFSKKTEIDQFAFSPRINLKNSHINKGL